MAKVNNVNHRNIIVIYNYLKAFAKAHGLSKVDINIFEQLGLSFPDNYPNAKSYYTDQKQWSPLETYVKCYLKLKEITGNPNIFRECGRSAVKYKSFSDWRVVLKSINGPKSALEYIPHVFPDWNDTKTFDYIVPPRFSLFENKVTALFKYVFHSHIDPCDDYCSDPHIKGLLEAIPTSFPRNFFKPWEKLPFGKITQKLVQYDPIKLFNSKFFSHLNLQPKYVGNNLYIRHPETGQDFRIGKKVVLATSTIKDKEVYTGKYTEFSSTQSYEDPIGTLILEDLEYKGEPICEKGVIMDAPWFCGEYTCQELYTTQKIWGFRNLLSGNQLMRDLVVKSNIDLRDEIEEKNKAYSALEAYSVQLEEKVEERTAELSQSLDTIKKTKDQLVQSEKMAALGSLVAGVAHEINTPIGVSVSAASHLFDKTEEFADMIKAERIKKSDVDSYTKTAATASTLILKNLNNAVKIVQGFKQVAVDQTSGERREFKLKAYIEDVLLSLQPKLKKTRHILRVDCPEDLSLNSFPGAFSQIISNLIMNSLIHGFEGKDTGEIIFEVSRKNSRILFIYKDNGRGMDEKTLAKIFDPFFTTKRSRGGSGLGMHIVHNLVTQTLGGNVSCDSSPDSGITLTIEIPIMEKL